ncbi:MAG TPA: hypothetical protein VGW38_01130, partial [Chloroflexota bacterium]|nr:hypothetical protein [Chloroflexota bacterium]
MSETQKSFRQQVKERLDTLSGVPRVVQLVWEADPRYTVSLVSVNVLQGLAPAANLWIAKLVVDVVAAAIQRRLSGDTAVPALGASAETLGLTQLLGLEYLPEAGSILTLILFGAVIRLLEHLLEPTASYVQIQLGDHLTREMQTRILRKANSLADISYFENPKFYDSLQRAQQDAGYRPMNLLAGTVGMFRT